MDYFNKQIYKILNENLEEPRNEFIHSTLGLHGAATIRLIGLAGILGLYLYNKFKSSPPEEKKKILSLKLNSTSNLKEKVVLKKHLSKIK